MGLSDRLERAGELAEANNAESSGEGRAERCVSGRRVAACGAILSPQLPPSTQDVPQRVVLTLLIFADN